MSVAPFILLVVVLALGWLLFVVPQRRRQAAREQVLGDLEVGVEILTVGGLYGTVAAIEEDEVLVEIAPGTNVRLDKRAIATVVPPEEPEEEGQDEPGEELDGGTSNEGSASVGENHG